VDELDAKVLFGGEFLNNEIGNFSVDHAAAITIVTLKIRQVITLVTVLILVPASKPSITMEGP
jgi:hypothetical protein